MDDTAAQPVANPLSAIPNYLRRDEAGHVIENLDTTNPRVERDPLHGIPDASTRRIAWREVKVKVGKIFAGKTVTWSMKELFAPSVVTTPGTATTPEVLGPDPGGPRFRGEWTHAERENDKQRFGPSEHFNAYGFNTATRNQTTVDPEGYTAIRVNVPPIGFNKARVSIEITDLPGRLDILDPEVPAVVVIDPGHGGGVPGATYSHQLDHDGNPSTPNESVSVSEATMVTDISLRLKFAVHALSASSGLPSKAILTRNDNTTSPLLQERPKVARNHGADIFFSIHMNSGASTARGIESFYRAQSNAPQYNLTEDMALASRASAAVLRVITGSRLRGEPSEKPTGARPDTESQHGMLAVLADGRTNGNGNIAGYTPCRATLLEVEFPSNPTVFGQIWGANGNNRATTRSEIADELAETILQDILTTPAQ